MKRIFNMFSLIIFIIVAGFIFMLWDDKENHESKAVRNVIESEEAEDLKLDLATKAADKIGEYYGYEADETNEATSAGNIIRNLNEIEKSYETQKELREGAKDEAQIVLDGDPDNFEALMRQNGLHPSQR